MIKNYFKIAWRNMWLHRRISFINIAGLSIGMAAAVLIMLWVQNELTFDAYHKDADNIYFINNTLQITKSEEWVWENSPYLLGDFAQKQNPAVINYTRLQPLGYRPMNIHYHGQLTSEKKCAYVDGQWFNFFHYDFVDGTPGSFLKDPFSLIVTESTAKRYFGNREAVGQILKIDTVNYQVQAVVKDNPANSSFQYDFLIPLAAKLANPQEKKQTNDWGEYDYITFLKIQPGANLKKVAASLDQIVKKNKNPDGGGSTASLVPLKSMHFETGLQNSSIEHGNRTMVKIFSLLAILLVLTACINYVNLSTARASLRSKEVSMRKIVGAARWQLFSQFMSESLLLSVFALAFAVLIVQLCLPWFNSVTDKNFIVPFASVNTWLILIGTLLICFVVNGIYPAVLLSSFKPLNIFRGKNVLNLKDAGLRRGLVVLQFTITVVLIIGTMVIYRQLRYMEKVDLGYDKSRVFEITVPWSTLTFDFKKSAATMSTIKDQLQQQSAISDVAISNTEAFYNDQSMSSGNFDWTGRPKDFKPSFCVLNVDGDFPKLMHLKLVEGHWFGPAKADRHNVVLNETAIKQLNIPKPVIGQPFRFQGDTGMVIGIAKDFHFRSLHDKISPMIITNHSDWASCLYIKAAPGRTQAAIDATKGVWTKFVAEQPFEFNFLDEGYNNLYSAEQKSSLLLSIFAVIAIVVSAMGLLGLVTFAAEKRVKEIGIRKVLGASVQNIVALLSADFLKMVLIASLIAFPIAWWASNKWLQDFAYKISLSWWIFLLAAFVALFIALVTISMQAIKAAVSNPVDSLRNE